MKKRVTVGELKDFVEKNHLSQITYYTENQNVENAEYALFQLRLSFPSMLIYENPNLVFLKSGDNSISVNGVLFAELDTESMVAGTMVTLYCGYYGLSQPTETHTLIIS